MNELDRSINLQLMFDQREEQQQMTEIAFAMHERLEGKADINCSS
jgi:hypothetical protein